MCGLPDLTITHLTENPYKGFLMRRRLAPFQGCCLRLFIKAANGLVVQDWHELDEALRETGYAMKDMPLFGGSNRQEG